MEKHDAKQIHFAGMRLLTILGWIAFGGLLLPVLLVPVDSWAADIEPLENRIKASMLGRKVDRDLEEEVSQRNLKKLIETLHEARIRLVEGNANFPFLKNTQEQKQYCTALLTDIKKGGTGITLPKPIMSTATHGNHAILERVIEMNRSCNDGAASETGKDIVSLIGGLTNTSYVRRLFDIYSLNGKVQQTVILNRTFYDNGYQQMRGVDWYEVDRDGCYKGGEAVHYPRKDISTDKHQAGVLTFHGQTHFYSVNLGSEIMPGTMGDEEDSGNTCDGCEQKNIWLISFYAPHNSPANMPPQDEAQGYVRRTNERLDYTCRIYFE